MRTVTVRDLQKRVKECVDEVQEDRAVVTRRGKPAAVLVGVEGQDWDSVVLQTDPAFWRMIRQRRRQPTVSLTELKRVSSLQGCNSRRFAPRSNSNAATSSRPRLPLRATRNAS